MQGIGKAIILPGETKKKKETITTITGVWPPTLLTFVYFIFIIERNRSKYVQKENKSNN